jgi:hypothetical protein
MNLDKALEQVIKELTHFETSRTADTVVSYREVLGEIRYAFETLQFLLNQEENDEG